MCFILKTFIFPLETALESGARFGKRQERMRNIQTETDFSTDRQTKRQADRQRRTDRPKVEGVCGETVRVEQGRRRGGWGFQGLTGQIREQE